jgi:hypothetical protein
MATGQMQEGGVFEWPATPEVGYEDWAGMSGMSPGHPLVGGSAGVPGYGGGQRQVAVAAPNPTAGVASGSPARANWAELFNLRGNPIGWVLIAAVLFLGLMHIHVKAGANAGFGAGVGKGR